MGAPPLVDIDVAGRARQASAAHGHQFVDAVLPNGLHEGQTGGRQNGDLQSLPCGENDLGHLEAPLMDTPAPAADCGSVWEAWLNISAAPFV